MKNSIPAIMDIILNNHLSILFFNKIETDAETNAIKKHIHKIKKILPSNIILY